MTTAAAATTPSRIIMMSLQGVLHLRGGGRAADVKTATGAKPGAAYSVRAAGSYGFVLFLALAFVVAAVAHDAATDADAPAADYAAGGLGAAPAAHAQMLSDATGLVSRLDVATGSGAFEVVVTSNFDITDYGFAASEKKLTLQTGPVLSENIAEIVIPADLLSGDFDVYVDGMQQDVSAKSSDAVAFLVLRFERGDDAAGSNGYGGSSSSSSSSTRTIEIVGTATSVSDVFSSEYNQAGGVQGTAGDRDADGKLGDGESDGGDGGPAGDGTGSDTADDGVRDSGSDGDGQMMGGGCLVATAAYGSEMSSHVQLLREIRDLKIAGTESGRVFLDLFNSVYYSFSPQVADHMRENPALRGVVAAYLTPMLMSLQIMGNAQDGSEYDVVGHGVLVILLNLGVYVAAPAAVVVVAAAAAAAATATSTARAAHR